MAAAIGLVALAALVGYAQAGSKGIDRGGPGHITFLGATACALNFSFDAFIQDLEAAIDAAGYERFALFGHSQGGAFAVEYAEPPA